MENWRANFSDSYDIVAAEILPEKPVIYSDLKKFVYNDFGSMKVESLEMESLDGFLES